MSIKQVSLWMGPLLFALVNFAGEGLGWSAQAASVLAVAAWILTWWISEAAPIAVTSLLPIVLFPLTGVLDLKAITALYGSHYVFLFMGGFLVAIALERVNLHKRLALMLLARVGTQPARIIMGFMLATALLSMWISNTATTLMMLPIAMSVIRSIDSVHPNFTRALLLGTAYAANIGGMSTLVGTPPNIAMAGLLSEQVGVSIGFLEWFQLTGPLAFLLLVTTFFVLIGVMFPLKEIKLQAGADWIRASLAALGKWRTAEKRVLFVFVGLATAWITRGMWNDLVGGQVSDTGLAVMAGILLFLIPAQDQDDPNRRLLEWEDTEKLPWNILLLFGGGLALAAGLKEAGILETMVSELGQWSELSALAVLILLVSMSLLLTEVMSNLALTVVMVPVVAAFAVESGLMPWAFAIPITWASSCAFMLPMATPPNAIIFGSQAFPMSAMVRSGVVLNVVAIVLIVFWAQFVLPNFDFS